MNYDLAKWVTNARRQVRLTQEELAEEIGFSGKGSVSALEKGRNKPTFEVMVKISEVCNYPLPYQNQVINNNANHIQVGRNNFGDAPFSCTHNDKIDSPLINLENVPRTGFIKPFLARVPDNDLQSEGIFKNDILTINPNIIAKHGDFIMVVSAHNRGIVAKLLLDIKNQHFLKYNDNQPEIMPSDANIIGVVINLNRNFS
ncbi:LexA family transcriptional regulator [Neisseria sicca]|uniref:LexA family transcriptional regulator n=1 Tax=Neisseria sicca TaxID=490 RepID=UPI000371B45C|nr:LexA family transcriptional regulator [Neisseria sicca]